MGERVNGLLTVSYNSVNIKKAIRARRGKMFEVFRRRRLEAERLRVKEEYFKNLAKQMELRKRLRELRSEHLREECEGTTKFSSGKFIAMSVDIPTELSALEAEFLKLEEQRESLQR